MENVITPDPVDADASTVTSLSEAIASRAVPSSTFTGTRATGSAEDEGPGGVEGGVVGWVGDLLPQPRQSASARTAPRTLAIWFSFPVCEPLGRSQSYPIAVS